MAHKKVLIVTDSPDIRSVFETLLSSFEDVETIWLDSIYPAKKLLEQSAVTPFSSTPDLLIVDLGTADLHNSHTCDQFQRWSKDILTLVIEPSLLNGGCAKCWGHIKSFDVITIPLNPVDVRYRLEAAFAHGKSQRRGSFFKAIAAEINAGLLVLDSSEKIIWLNGKAEELLGYDKDALLERFLPSLSDSLAVIKETGATSSQNFTLKMIRKDGSDFWARCLVGSFSWPEEKGFTVILSDISEDKKREEELHLSAKVFEYSGEAIIITDGEDRILQANGAFIKTTGYAAEEILGRQPDFLYSGKHDAKFYENMWATVHHRGHWHGEVWNRKKSGEIFPQWMAVTAVTNADDEVDHYVTIFSDITDRLSKEKNLRHLAQHDFLTGLPNRVLLNDRFSQAAANAWRTKSKIAVMFIDLDKFKIINDRDGHTVGDQLLQRVAERLLALLRSSDTASRWGGDEFVLLLPGENIDEKIFTIGNKLLKQLEQPFMIDGTAYAISASIGVSLYPEQATNLDDLLALADSAMYQAKETAGGSITLYEKKP